MITDSELGSSREEGLGEGVVERLIYLVSGIEDKEGVGGCVGLAVLCRRRSSCHCDVQAVGA